ncbi:unnamed protein product, partial [Mesorhabditis belari]|uniref:Protein kinase domain-containing protein n=1 Tax=Mesorhabditis belari TaxID=2138241 RepID=A0AAF3EAR6_9BILA
MAHEARNPNVQLKEAGVLVDQGSEFTEHCSISYMTPWATVLAMSALYSLALLWFCKHGKKMCLPAPDTIFPYQKRLKAMKRELGKFLVDDVFIEITDDKLGQGAVGFVFKGFVYPRTQNRYKQKLAAAIKMSYPIPLKSMGLLEEACRMAKLEHSNIVALLAVSKLSFTAFRPLIVMEWLPGGSLAEYFREEIRRKEENERAPVFVRSIISILTQVGEALKYLHDSRDDRGQELTHGDVAARNVLLTSKHLDTCVAKLGDFGLPIDFGPRLPVPWLPPEIVCALDSNPVHRTECDVWMFGVLAWECVTLGAEPHYQRTIREIQACYREPDRGLTYPSACPAQLWSLILECLSEQHRRPRFLGPVDGSASALHKLRQLRHSFATSTHCLEAMPNEGHCTCAQHRCHIPLPSFGKDDK